jgi:RNA polymerase sigma-70 factor, ECF subfamily
MTVAIALRQPGVSPSDAELLAKIGREDLSALGALFDRHHRRVARVLMRTGVSSADTDDLVQSTFLEVPKIARVFDGRDSCAAWLCGIAVRLASRRRRSLGRLLRTWTSYASSAPTTTLLNPESEVASRQELDAFARALEKLAQKKREAFVMVELEGFTAEEVAHSLGANAATIRTRLHHARNELRAVMKQEVW